MEKVRILGVVGSPRKNGNTAKLVDKALGAISEFPWVETDLFSVAGKKIAHCISCYKCMEKGQCIIEDGLFEYQEKFVAADGILWAVPVYHMSVPSIVKALLDRFGNMKMMHFLARGKNVPRFSKVCGVLTNGASHYGGQDLTLSFLVNSCLVSNNVVVSGDTFADSYIGAAAWTGQMPNPLAEDNILKDESGVMSARSVAVRVAEMARIIKAGKAALGDELSDDYASMWELNA